MKKISSAQNEEIKHLINLQKRSYREEQGQFIVEGTRACTQLLQSYKAVAFYMTPHYFEFQNIDIATDSITIVSQAIMNKISSTKTPSGICAIFTIPESKPLPTSGPGLILIETSDPGNMGTLIRTAAAMNVKEVILVGGVDPYNPKVIQSTAGCLTNVNIYQVTFEQLVAQKILEMCALVVKNGRLPNQINLKNKFLVVGNESHGLSNEQIAACNEKLTIPMPGQAESLNAAIAGSIGLYLMTLQN